MANFAVCPALRLTTWFPVGSGFHTPVPGVLSGLSMLSMVSRYLVWAVSVNV